MPIAVNKKGGGGAILKSGYTNENLVDTIVLIGDKIITNYLHGVTRSSG